MLSQANSQGRKPSGAMRGTKRKISLPRRFLIDLMHASVQVPAISFSRPLDIGPFMAARAKAKSPLGWAAVFVKAFAIVAQEEPVLRTLRTDGQTMKLAGETDGEVADVDHLLHFTFALGDQLARLHCDEFTELGL